MKRFWKKTNRGLWLGLALLVFLLVFIVVRQVRFRMEKPKIRELAKSYVAELLNVNAEMGDANGGEPMTDEQKKAQNEALEAVIRKYWYQGEKDISNGYLDAVNLRLRLAKWQESAPNRLTELQLQFSDEDASVRADGPNRALVYLGSNLTVAKVKGYESDSKSIDLFPAESSMRNNGEEYGEFTLYGSVSFQMEMERRGGKWYVVSMNALFGSNNIGYGGLWG